MNQENGSRNIALLSFFAGVVVGAVVVALTTPKSGPEVREDLKGLGRRAKAKVGELGGKAEEVWVESKTRASQAMADLKRGVQDAALDLSRGTRQGAGEPKHETPETADNLRG